MYKLLDITTINHKLLSLNLIILLLSSSLFAKEKNINQVNGFLSQNAQPVAFEENKGQVYGLHDGLPKPEVCFTYGNGTAKIFLMKTGLAYQFAKMHYPKGYISEKDTYDLKKREKQETLRTQIRNEIYRMDMELINANPDARITMEGMSSDYVNYYNRDVMKVYSYTKVTYHDIYPGINWVIYTAEGTTLKYDFVVQPGVDPKQIRMRFSHTNELKLNPDGSLFMGNHLGSVTEQKPVSYAAGKFIESRFVLKGDELHFNFDTYDTSQILTIDPVLKWSTYYGSNGIERGYSCATDASGYVYLAGTTNSGIDIASGGHQNISGGTTDAFLVKFDSSGVRQWATYYGGSGQEIGYACSIDGASNVYLAGTTYHSFGMGSNGHQNIPSGICDAFLVKFNSSGMRQWATYYGGNEGDFGRGCSTDIAGNIYLSGNTNSTSDIAFSGPQNTYGGGDNDAFLVKFNSAGVRQWATYYGGSENDYSGGCVTDASGNVYLSGITESTGGIASGGHQNTLAGGVDAFLAKFNSLGVRQWATYYGGIEDEFDNGNVCTDPAGNVYIAGTTLSSFNIASGGHQNSYGGGYGDVFLAKFNSSGVRQWATYYGGPGGEAGLTCTADIQNNVYLGGTTGSTSGISSAGYQNTFGGSTDAFLVKFNNSGVRQWATYFGGSKDEHSALDCAVDVAGNVYLAGVTNSISGIASGGYQNVLAGGNNYDAFLAKFSFCPYISDTLNIVICQGQSYTFNGNTYTTTQNGLTATFQTSAGCDSIVTLNLTIAPFLTGIETVSICAGQNYTFNGISYNSSNNTAKDTLQSATGCDSIVTLDLTVATAIISTLNETICPGQSYTFNGNSYTTPQNGLTATFQSMSGCDSIVTLNLSVMPSPITENIQLRDCNSVSYNGNTYYQDTILYDTFYAQSGCDSILRSVNIDIHGTPPLIINRDTVACRELQFGGQHYSESTMISDTLKNFSGCDSIIINTDILIEKMDLLLNISTENPYSTEFFTLSVENSQGTDFTVLRWLPANLFPDNRTAKMQRISINSPQNIWVIGTSAGICTDTASIYIEPRPYSKDVVVPNAFTPNGDGINDVFKPVLLLERAYSLVEFWVANRYGQLVHSTANMSSGWDGTFNGKPVDQGVYFYLIRIRFSDGSEKTFQGDVILIR